MWARSSETGFSGIPRGIIKDGIIRINESNKKILSIDLPSGLPSNGEAPAGVTIRLTVYMGQIVEGPEIFGESSDIEACRIKLRDALRER